MWERVLAAEPDQDKADRRELLQGMLDPQLHLAPAIRTEIAGGDFDILFLTGIGEVFPIRSHNVLNNLQSVVTGKPMLMFFPAATSSPTPWAPHSCSLGDSKTISTTGPRTSWNRKREI